MKFYSMPIGEFEEATLLALVRLNRGAYGMEVLREIEERLDRMVSIGALYATLDRLEKKGLISSTLGEKTAKPGGKAKRYFKIKQEGLRVLAEAKAETDKMWEGIHIDPAWST